MAIFAGGQQTAINPAYWQAGVPTQGLLDGYTYAKVCMTDIKVGIGCFYSQTTGGFQQTAPTTGVFAGIVMRSNANSMSYLDSRLGFSEVITAGFTAQVITRGTVPVYLALANETGALPKIGSAIYVMADGTFQSQSIGGTAPTGGTITNFRVSSVGENISGYVWAANGLVEITNTQNCGA